MRSWASRHHWTQADPSLIKHCSRIRAQKLSDSNNNNSMSDCNLQSGPWRVNNNNQQRFSMSDCNLGRDDLCRTTIWAMTIYAGLQSGPWRDSYSLYPVLYAGSTSSLGQDETVSTYTYLYIPTYTYIKSFSPALSSTQLVHRGRVYRIGALPWRHGLFDERPEWISKATILESTIP